MPLSSTRSSPSQAAPDAPAASGALQFPIIGLGASAGGLEALIKLFEHLPERSGMAFVVILHLSPEHESSAAEILQRATAMPVMQVTSPHSIEADRVYVIPPGVDLTLREGYLRPTPREKTGGTRVAVDIFFRTLAQMHRERAVCVVLSGTGSDGAVGLTHVKEQGGVTIAQLPEDAAHDGMPRAAIATSMVDFVLPAADIGQCLLELWANAQRITLPDADGAAPFTEAPSGPLATQQAEEALQEIMALLRSYTRHDFRHYKRATVLRRIERRLQVNRLVNLPAYRDFLRDHPEEAKPLLQDMLISVTTFFRDREAFDALETEAIAHLVAGNVPGEQVRVWVAGCATGEEAYSLSILLREQAEGQSRKLDLQVFATDIDERAIAAARRGVYPEGIAEDMSADRLRRFFVREQDEFRIATTVREPVLFAVHNLLRDPPFSRLDVVCCRNLLIYLDRTAQTHVLEMFRQALKPDGILFLGTSESADAVSHLFTPVDKKHRIFRVNPEPLQGSRNTLPLIREFTPLDRMAGRRSRPADGMAKRVERASFPELHQRAIVQFSPPSVLVDADLNVLHLSHGVGQFMERSGGAPSDNLLNNVRPDIRLELRTALFKAEQTQASVSASITQRHEEGRHTVLNITVRPLPAEQDKALTLVVFEEAQELDQPAGDDEPDQAQLIAQLEEQIRQLKLHLQDTIESSETANEDLKASNEELQAINEELRSATEELETSKEELQSMNEELATVNFELKVKVEERGHINDDLQNLIASSEIATVFVDRDMRVKRYTPHASQLFNLIPSDVGRSLFDITTRLNYPQLSQDTASAFKDLRAVERQVLGTDGRHFMARILPYRTADDKIEGAILNFFDITELRAAEERVRAGVERLKFVAATTRDFAIITTSREGAITTWNAGAQRIFGYTEEEMAGRLIHTIFTAEDQANGVPDQEMRTALAAGRAEDERWHRRRDGSRFFASGVMTPMDDSVGGGFAKIARDMTGTKQQELMQEHLLFKEKKASLTAQTANELKDKFLAVMSHELKQPLNLIQMNAELLLRLPLAREEVAARRIGDTIKRAVKSQTRIINDLLDLSRARTGKLRLDRVPLDLRELVHNLCASATSHLPEPRVVIEVTNAPGELICIGDRLRVEQIVWNLLTNAVKFTPADGLIRVALESESDFARVTVADSGCGIAPEFLPHVFGMFNQAHLEVTLPNGGLGIGLALVHELAHAQGGRAEVASPGLGQGATFTVWLPLSGAEPTQASDPSAAPQLSLDGWRVLAVDDYIDGLLPFAEVLRLEGATVDVAQSARQALELLATNTYDLLISDLGMPEMDGYQLISQVRRQPLTQGLPAIAMSGFGRRVDARKALNAGFNAHVPKPASVEDIKVALARL